MYHESPANSVHNNPRIKALIEKHAALSDQIKLEQKNPASSDFYINQLKKQKLLIKEKISHFRDDKRVIYAE